MVMVKVNARDKVVQVLAADAISWLEVANLQTIGIDRAANEEKADTTTMDSDGEYEEEIMQRGRSLSLEGLTTKDRMTGAMDPGQARCLELANGKGYDSLGVIRVRDVMDTTWDRWNCTFSLGEEGGGTNDKSKFACTVTKSGPATTMAVA